MRQLIYIFVLMFVVAAMSVASQPSPTPDKTAKWQTFSNKDEISVAIPEGATGFTEENDYFLGRGLDNRVSKRVVMSVIINGTVLIAEVYEGDVRNVRNELIKRLPTKPSAYELLKEQDFEGVNVQSLRRSQESLYSYQQFVLFKKRLYVLQAHANSEKDFIIEQFLKSLVITVNKNSVMPNLSPGDDAQIALKPADITIDSSKLTSDDTVLTVK